MEHEPNGQQPPASRTPAIPATLPVLPLRESVVFPLALVPLAVGQERSIRLVDDVMRGDRMLALVTQRSPDVETAGPADLHDIGTAAVIHQLARGADGALRVLVQGIERIRLGEFVQTEPYLRARVEPHPDVISEGVETQALRRAVLDLFRRVVALVEDMPNELVQAAEGLTDPRHVAYLVAAAIPLPPETRQELLRLDPVDAKLQRLVDLLQHELAVRELGRQIANQTQERMTKQQREYLLREQLRSIQSELGEGGNDDLDELRRKLDEANLPEEARREADRELRRLSIVPQASPEHGIIRTYLDWLASLPWTRVTGGTIDVKRAREVLDEDHFDLDKVKERILEYLAVRQLQQQRAQAGTAAPAGTTEVAARSEVPHPPSGTPAEPVTQPGRDRVTREGREPILCFVGPPGVGKTSLGQSIARAMGRAFVRMSLGGVRDEAEIRGHRRTYIGALPGRIIQGIQRAGSADPVMMLDEVDKLSVGLQGDPAAALLEVLDPAQNHAFVDNYLGVPFDLSRVLFICTANTLDTIPGPLRDRLEIIEVPGYAEGDKFEIARRYLIPQQLKAHALRPDELEITDDALRHIIRAYTREAGVRGLQREIATIVRKVARRIAEGAKTPIRVAQADVHDYLGRPRFYDEVAERTDRPGVATGLAWTPAGGDVLFVEAAMMPSDDEQLILTGMLGDVMRESAQAALTYLRSNAERYGIDPSVFKGKAVHVHVPAGAVPKDGPSAGVTILAALASLASGRPVRSDVAMTGEITLRGKVLPVGGIKEKVLAAHRAGIKTVILPRRNMGDTEDVPAEAREALTFIPADSADDILANALEPAPTKGEAAAGDGSRATGKGKEKVAARGR